MRRCLIHFALCLAASFPITAIGPGRAPAARAADAATPVMEDAPCSLSNPCEVPTGEYFIHVPSGWDGKSRLPTLVYIHGYGGSAQQEVGSPDMIKMSDDLGMLLVTPNGQDKAWSYPGSPHQGRDDIAYILSVVDDVEKRFPIDRARLWASGFSIGASMVWYLACYEGSHFAAYAPIAGSFWDPMPTKCPSGPVNMRHIHGLTDHTMPLAGRALRGGLYRQSNVRQGFELWKTIDACPAQPTHQQTLGVVTCNVYDDCASGKELQFCLHPGEHEVWTQWLRDDYAWIDALAKKQATAAQSSAAASPAHPATVAR